MSLFILLYLTIQNLEPYPEVSDIINPFNTLQNNSTIIKRLNFGGTITANYQLDTWVEYFQQIAISSMGGVTVMR